MNIIKIYTTTKLIGRTRAFIALVDSDGFEIYVQTNELSSYRSLMIGIKKVLEKFKSNSKIEILSPGNFGFKYLRNNKKWINRDLGELLMDIIKNNNLDVVFTDYSKSQEYDDIKTVLKKKLKLKYSDDGANKNTSQINLEPIVNEYNETLNYGANDCSFKVNLLVRGIADVDGDRNGKYICILQCKGKELELNGKGSNTTSQRMLLKGIIEGINQLNKPCDINIYLHGSIGLYTFNVKQLGANKDLKEQLLYLIKDNNHSVKILCDSKVQVRLINELMK